MVEVAFKNTTNNRIFFKGIVSKEVAERFAEKKNVKIFYKIGGKSNEN